jgi:hypothetical protein
MWLMLLIVGGLSWHHHPGALSELNLALGALLLLRRLARPDQRGRTRATLAAVLAALGQTLLDSLGQAAVRNVNSASNELYRSTFLGRWWSD